MEFGIAEFEPGMGLQGLLESCGPFGFVPKIFGLLERVPGGKHEPDFIGNVLVDSGFRNGDMSFVDRVEGTEIEECQWHGVLQVLDV